MSNKTTQTNKPAKEFRMGQIKVAIWKEEKDEKPIYSFKFTKSYKDGEDWKETDYNNLSDLPKIQELARKAYAWTYEQ